MRQPAEARREASAPAPWRLALLLALLVAFILYGSLWPFRWRPLPPGTPLGPLLLDHLLRAPGGRGDVLANLLLYAPLGFLLGALLPGRWPAAARLLVPGLAGALLSALVELLQIWVGGRVSSGADLALNAIGALAGAGLALLLGGRALFAAGHRHRLADPMAGLLVLAWLGWRFHPYVPALDWQAWKDNLKPLLLHPVAEPLRTTQLLVSWTSAALLAEAAAGAAARWLVPAGLGVALAAEVAIPGKALTLAEALALGAALPAWAMLRRDPARAAPAMAAAMLGVLLIERLAPFEFVAMPRSFGWIPFRSLVAGSLGAGLQAILAKLFLQGAALFWLLRCGLRLWPATALLAALVFVASLAQCWLPGRSAEITDTLLALGLGLAFHLLRPRERAA